MVVSEQNALYYIYTIYTYILSYIHYKHLKRSSVACNLSGNFAFIYNLVDNKNIISKTWKDKFGRISAPYRVVIRGKAGRRGGVGEFNLVEW